MAQNVAQKLINSHLVSGTAEPGHEIGVSIDQTLTQDATGTMVMLELKHLRWTGSKLTFPSNTLITTYCKLTKRTPKTTIFYNLLPNVMGSGFPNRATGYRIRCTRPDSGGLEPQ